MLWSLKLLRPVPQSHDRDHRRKTPDCTCTLGDGCTHTRTRLDPRARHIPYQIDYRRRRPRSPLSRLLQHLATDEWFGISDQAPIVADFDRPD